MATTSPATIFGVHSLTILDQITFTPIKTFKVVGDLTVPFETDLEILYGGSNRFAWEAEPKTFKTEMAISLKQFDNAMFTYLSGAAVTETAAEASGAVTTLTNRYGALVSATIGVASVSVTTAAKADLKAGLYVVKAASATTVDVFATTDVDFSAGTALTILSDDMKVASALSITTGGATVVTGLGVTLTGGSGTIALTTGDTATFEIRPINVGAVDITLGNFYTVLPRLAIAFAAQKKGSGEVFYGFAPKVQPAGFSIPMKEMAFATGSEKLMLLYDNSLNYVAKLRRIIRTLG